MVRFIFVCMAVVAVSVVAIGTDYIRDGISDETAAIAARNVEPAATDAQFATIDETPSAEELNAIETTAGGEFDPNDTFKGGFTNQAPKALSDTPATSPEAERDIPVAGPPVTQPSAN